MKERRNIKEVWQERGKDSKYEGRVGYLRKERLYEGRKGKTVV